MECPICMDEFDLEKNENITTTPCCKQKLHEMCKNSTISFYNENKQDTPCPFCRSIISIYIDNNVENIQVPTFPEQIHSNSAYDRFMNSSFVKRNFYACCSFLFVQLVVITSMFLISPVNEVLETM